MKKNSIYVVIPVFNRIIFTRDCLKSIYNQTWKNYKIIVVDDGSTDGTKEMLINEFPEVHIIQGNGNLWWTKATNLGVRYALENNADFILTLNNDTILFEDFLDKMLFWAEKYPNALFGSLALDRQTREIVYGGEIINWKWAIYDKILDKIPDGSRKGLYEVSHFPGRGLLIPSDVFKKIGLFDEKNFPHYAADYDFTHRAIRHCYKVFVNYDSKIIIFPDESGSVKLRENKNIGNYINHLTSFKGGGNLKIFIKYAWINCPKKHLVTFTFMGVIRRIFGYWKISIE